MNLNDWRLQGQEKYLYAAILQYKNYGDRITLTDHDHCEFCFKKFSNLIPGSLLQGYTTLDNYRWICEDCYADFNDYFKWKKELL